MFHDKKIVIAGGTGYIGRAMAARWAADNEVVVLTRNAAGKADNTYGVHYEAGLVQYVHWDARHLGDWVPRLEGCDLLINLAGRSVNCRYTAANRQEIITSRVAATRLLGAALRQLKQPPALWINGASATIYRHADDRAQDEFTGEIEDDFSVQVCKAWEHAFAEAAVPGTRKAVLRMAIVLGKGGALVPYTRLVKCGLGGRHGSGKQMFSWIHETDLCCSARPGEQQYADATVAAAIAPSVRTAFTGVGTEDRRKDHWHGNGIIAQKPLGSTGQAFTAGLYI
jgi:uncharacterized protein (TIGR01777 family)